MTYRTPLTLLFAAGLALGGQTRAEGTLHFANWSDYKMKQDFIKILKLGLKRWLLKNHIQCIIIMVMKITLMLTLSVKSLVGK